MDPDWKDIPGYEGYYAVSTRGEVKSLRGDRLLALVPDKDGYLRAHLSVKGRRKRHLVHRLVAMAFLSHPTKEQTQVNHRDNNPANNQVENLEWITGNDNLKQAYRKRLSDGAISRELIRDVYLAFHNESLSAEAISKRFNIGRACVGGIVQRRSWREVTEPLDSLLIPPSPVVPFDEERWCDIIGYEGQYRISTSGRVYSIKNDCFLEPFLPRPNGRLIVNLHYRNRGKSMFVHRLVALHFIPNPNKFPLVHHRDHDRLNNRVDNLQWCNQSHNIREAFIANKISRLRGESHHQARLSSIQVDEIRQIHAQGQHSYADLGRQFGVCSDTIRRIVKRRIWKRS